MKRTIIRNLILLLAVSNHFSANCQNRDIIKEHQFEIQLKELDTSLVEIYKAATIALDKPNFTLADSLYTIIYNKAPMFDPAIRRLGGIKMELGKIQEGLDLCEKAVKINRSYDNIITLASCLVNSGGQDGVVSTPNLGRARDLLNEVYKLPGANEYEYTVLFAQIALQLNQEDNFNNATKTLMERHSDKMASHYFSAISNAQAEEWAIAEKEILIAKAMGLSDTNVDEFLDSGVHRKASILRYGEYFLWILLIWLVGFFLLYIVGLLLSNYTLSSLERHFRTNSTTKLSNILRSFYRFLINIAGVYYYISLPIILILVIVLVVGIFYVFLMVGHIPIQLMLILIVGSGFTIYGMIRSLLLKVKYNDPGRELKESDAPGLFALTKEVANTMGTRPIDEIRITPETDLAVYETGTWKEKFRDKGKRILIIGTGVLKDFKQNDFRAVLAHEYGHFSNRDTAGGAVALRVRNDMHNYSYALYAGGQTVWWNLAFQFLRLYDFIFRRISNGATRLQEILADRVAAQTYGAQSFQNGLTYVIKRNIEFVKLANIEIEEARKIKRPFNNLYELSGSSNEAIEEEYKISLNRQTSMDDTHPSPVDRFRFIEGLGKEKTLNNNFYVRDLFVNWDSLTLEMTKSIEDSWQKNGE